MKTAIAALCCFLAACSAPPVVQPISPAQQIQKDLEVGTQLIERFEANTKLRQDTKVTAYLTALTRLLNSPPTLEGLNSPTPSPSPSDSWGKKEPPPPEIPFVVKLINEKAIRNFSLPVNHLYFSIPYLKAVEFESELAAAIAFELAHLKNRDIVLGLQDQDARRKERDIFDYPDDVLLNDVDAAISILYDAGYDGRGLVAYWQRLKDYPGKSGFSISTLNSLLDHTRLAIAALAPLRNPVVQTEKFLVMKKRIKKL